MDVRTTSPRDLLSIALAGSTSAGVDAADRVHAIDALRSRIDQEEQEIAFSLRHRGATWAEIGNVWGITRQAAHERFRDSAGLVDQLDVAMDRGAKP